MRGLVFQVVRACSVSSILIQGQTCEGCACVDRLVVCGRVGGLALAGSAARSLLEQGQLVKEQCWLE